MLAVALAQEMPVTETLALRSRLRESLGLELAATVVNACLPERLGPRQAGTVAEALDARASADGVVRAALRAAASEHARASVQREQIARLAEGLAAPPLELPYVFAPALDASALGTLADLLEELL